MKILIKNGRVLNPATETDEILDVYIEDGVVREIAADLSVYCLESHGEHNPSNCVESINFNNEQQAIVTKSLTKYATNDESPEKSDEVKTHQPLQIIDATNCWVTPGFIDLHVHLRDPGLTYKEDMMSGTQAAARGGFTTIVAMANTNPVIDSVETYLNTQDELDRNALVQVIQVASLTKHMEGQELVDIPALKKAGLLALSEDGKTVQVESIFTEAMKQATDCDLLVLDHCEDEFLKRGGVMNEGVRSDELGLPGISNAVEDMITDRDLSIAKRFGSRLHLQHVSTHGSVDLIRQAKAGDNQHITAEVCPHHLILTDHDIMEGDSNYKMAPPLRSSKDVQALIQGLQDGTIDAIATDHAPHAEHEKGSDLLTSAFGIVGLETAVPLIISELVKPELLTPLQMVEKMSYHPAQILRIDKGDLSVGKIADITIVDPNVEFEIDKDTFVSKGRNTPFHGWKVFGEITYTIRDGHVIYTSKT